MIGAAIARTSRNEGVSGMVSVGIFVPASVLFPDSDLSFAAYRSLLQGLSRTDVLFWCARLNHVLAGTTGFSHEQRQAFGLRQFSTLAQLRSAGNKRSVTGRRD